jgi:hypothetical protein
MTGRSSEEVAVLQGGRAAVAHGEGGADFTGEGVEQERGLVELNSFYGGRCSRSPLPLTLTSYVPAAVSALGAAGSAMDADADAATAHASLLVILLPTPDRSAPPSALSISKRNSSSQRKCEGRTRWRQRRNGRRRTSRTARSATTTTRWTRRRTRSTIPNLGCGASGACVLAAFFLASFFSCLRSYVSRSVVQG